MLTKLARHQFGTIQKSFRISIAFIVAIFLTHYLQLGINNWLILTTIVLYAGFGQGFAMRRSIDRFLGTVIGIFAAFYFCTLLLTYHYQWIYILILFYLAGLYLAILKNQYLAAMILLTLLVIPYIAISSPQNTDLRQLIALRVYYTGLACVIVIICELVIFPRADLIGDKINQSIRQLCESLADTLRNCNDNFVNAQSITAKTFDILTKNLKLYNTVMQHYFNQIHELRYSHNNNQYYQSFFRFIEKISPIIHQIMAISSHHQHAINSQDTKNSLSQLTDILATAVAELPAAHETSTVHNDSLTERIQTIAITIGSAADKTIEIQLLIRCYHELSQLLDAKSTQSVRSDSSRN